ncbi:hypothetical protein AAG570_010984 [Ranatra chinensis]|uniref:CHK kinase-like domain-containing protein n=1 Tax=Ranatra chinensis TaxID=642074 RepID=A0ABD0YVJ0_9HEMI
MKQNDAAGFERTKTRIKELIFVPEAIPVFGASLENALKMATKSLKVQGPGPGDMLIDEAVHKLQLLRGTVFQRMVALVAPKEPLSVICHGDFWINNMLFRYDTNGKVEDVMLIDLQVARYGCLATDILHFLYTSLEPGLTVSHYEDLLEAYHESLSSTAMRLAPGAPPVTLEQVTDLVEERALYGLLISFLLLPAVTAEDTIVNEEFLDQAADSLTPGYRKRVREIVLEFVDRGFI